MRESRITAEFKADLQTVWNVVTNNQDYEWRSDLDRIEIIDRDHFREYAKGGARTDFKINIKQALQRYEFRMENKFFRGDWVGVFSGLANGGTRIDFYEKLNFRNPLYQLISYFGLNLAKIQETYVADLRRKLGE